MGSNFIYIHIYIYIYNHIKVPVIWTSINMDLYGVLRSDQIHAFPEDSRGVSCYIKYIILYHMCIYIYICIYHYIYINHILCHVASDFVTSSGHLHFVHFPSPASPRHDGRLRAPAWEIAAFDVLTPSTQRNCW